MADLSLNGRDKSEISEQVRRRVCENLQRELSGDIDIIQKGGELVKRSQLVQEEFNQKASVLDRVIKDEKSRLVSEAQQILASLEEALDEVDDGTTVQFELESTSGEGAADSGKLLSEIHAADKELAYLSWIEIFQEQEDRIRCALACDAVHDACSFLQGFFDWCEESRESNAAHLVSYLNHLTIYWVRIVSDRLARDLPSIFAKIAYPKTGAARNARDRISCVDQKSLLEMRQVVRALLAIKTPESLNVPSAAQNTVPTEPVVPTPVTYFLAPLEKRFRYHFIVADKTNKLEKPEWYLAFVLNSIRDYADLVDSILRPVYVAEKHTVVDVKAEFATGLCNMAKAKFLSSLPLLLDREQLFAHAIDELLGFSRTLQLMGYETVSRDFCRVLCVPEVFQPWLRTEKALAETRMASFFETTSPWKIGLSDYGDSPEDLRVPECARQLSDMLVCLIERMELIPCKPEQLEFLDLYTTCAEEFLARTKLAYEEADDVLQKTLIETYPAMANAVRFIGQLVADQLTSLTTIPLITPSLFDKPAEMQLSDSVLRRMNKFMEECDRFCFSGILQHMQSCTVAHLARSFRYYSRMEWEAYPLIADFLLPSVTSSMGEFLVSFRLLISAQRDRLFGALFSRYIVSVMAELDEALFKQVLTPSSFSEGGLAQLKIDVLDNLLPVVVRISGLEKGGLFKTVGAVTILTTTRGSAVLLHEMASRGSRDESRQLPSLLHDMGISHLSADIIRELLEKRRDLNL